MLLGICFDSFCQPYVVYDTIPIKHGTNKLRLYRNINKWFEKEKGQKLLAKNRKELKFKGKGYFPYANYIHIPDIYLSSHAAEKTKGNIVFSISIEIQDSIIITKFSNFIHEARYTEYGSTSFGRLMDYDKVPSGKCMEVEEWCNAVWDDMKAWAYYETKTRAKRMIPSTLIRKRTFKVEEEKQLEPPKTKPYDPSEYLKLENYLIKDTEGKYADYNKDPEEIAAEKAAAAAALAEKEKKKEKNEETEPKEDFVEEETANEPDSDKTVEETPAAAKQKPAAEEKKKTKKSKPADEYDDADDSDEDEDDEPVKEKVTKEKTAKEKSAKPAKEKKPKKDDFDYDDYDDYDD